MVTKGSQRGEEYRVLWERLGFFLQDELESAYLNAIRFYQEADVLSRAGRQDEAMETLAIARASWGRATGLRDAVRTMPVMQRRVLRHATLELVDPEDEP